MMNRRRYKSDSEDSEIGYSETLVSRFGEKEERNHGELRDNPIYKQFQNKFRQINNISEKKLIPLGESLRLIVLQFGSPLEDIQFGKLDEVKDFIERNIDNRYALLAPELHAYLLRCDYYSKSRTSVAPKAMLAGYCNTVLSMMGKGRPHEEFLRLGIEVSKI